MDLLGTNNTSIKGKKTDKFGHIRTENLNIITRQNKQIKWQTEKRLLYSQYSRFLSRIYNLLLQMNKESISTKENDMNR